MSEVTLFDKVRTAREGMDVERCHSHPHSMRYSVGHHTAGLVALLILTWQEEHGGAYPRAELLAAATFHDVPERLTGDIPSTMKPLFSNDLDVLEERFLTALGVCPELTEKEQAWLDIADKVELYLWCLEEAHARGYLYFLTWVGWYNKYFRENPPPLAFRQIMAQASANPGAMMRTEDLKKMGGIYEAD